MSEITRKIAAKAAKEVWKRHRSRIILDYLYEKYKPQIKAAVVARYIKK